MSSALDVVKKGGIRCQPRGDAPSYSAIFEYFKKKIIIIIISIFNTLK